MDEALDQRAALTIPPPQDDPNATRAHAALSRDREGAALLTVPFRAADRFVGAATFERPAERPFAPEEVARLDFVVALAGAALAEKRAADRTLLAVARDAAWAQLKRLFGPRHPGRKAALATAAALVAVLATWTGPYRVSADAVVEGALERSLAAPWEGFLLEAPVRAGDIVAEGDLIAALDDAELALERLRWATERREHEFEYRRALDARDRAEAAIRRARAEGAAARIALIDGQIARARLTAPFDGVIVSGDRSQEIGAAVARGETLFEIAPLDDYRIALFVDEARIGDVRAGAAGELVATALPDLAFPLEVVIITPVAAPRDGRNAFRVEARLTGDAEALRPGMEGVAKIAVDERLRVEIWTRAFVDWARLTLWKWFG
jgi:multidrug efflux pump subunit AcrA (membrane-fusion protein)